MFEGKCKSLKKTFGQQSAKKSILKMKIYFVALKIFSARGREVWTVNGPL